MPHEMWTWHHGIKVKLRAEVRLPDCFQITAEESPNQDSWCMLKTDDFSIYGVFDGHGQKGALTEGKINARDG